jgi:hypothetical protein|tara:strand:- start:2532 stop:2951 length:420 start_codon:yes stop_codon:yes gene_type:complete
MTNKTLLKDLQNLIEENLDPSMFPYQKGNSIRIGKMVVRDSKNGFLIYDCKDNKQVAITFSKTAALALAKSISNGTDNIDKVLDLDKTIEKNFTDALFFTNTLKITKDDFKKDITLTRLELATARTAEAKSALDLIIFR